MSKIDDFLKSINYKPVLDVVNAVGNTVKQTAQDVGNTFTSPLRDIPAYYKLQSDPEYKKVQASNVPIEQKIKLNNKIGERYGGSTSEQLASANRGGALGMSFTTGDEYVKAGMPFVKPALSQVKYGATQAINSIDDAVKVQGGYQAGYIKNPFANKGITVQNAVTQNVDDADKALVERVKAVGIEGLSKEEKAKLISLPTERIQELGSGFKPGTRVIQDRQIQSGAKGYDDVYKRGGMAVDDATKNGAKNTVAVAGLFGFSGLKNPFSDKKDRSRDDFYESPIPHEAMLKSGEPATKRYDPKNKVDNKILDFRAMNPGSKLSDSEIIKQYVGDVGKTAAPKKSVLGLAKEKAEGKVRVEAQEPTPTSAPKSNYKQVIRVPDSQDPRSTKELPPEIAQALMSGLDEIKEATNAAKVLHHPREQTYTANEIKRFGHESWNHGENASFKTGTEVDVKQTDGSVDRGLMRINSGTFDGMKKRHPDWLEEEGIKSWDDMLDPVLNVHMAKLVLRDSNYAPEFKEKIRKNPSWQRWFAAPLNLRTR